MVHTNKHTSSLEGTERVEMFSDGVIAIIITILILEIHVPEIHTATSFGVWEALMPIVPKLAGFLVSFVTIAIFWVNHHHFFHPIEKTDGKLLWYNNFLLLWLAIVPFVTAFLGDYPTISLVVALYAFVLSMAATAFAMMLHYVFFRSHLLPESISIKDRRFQYKRSLLGVLMYGSSVALAFVHPYISLAIFVLVPLYFFLPQKIND